MNYLKKTESGFAQLVVLGVMALMAVALPLTTNLVKQNQENRSKAAEEGNNSSVPVFYFGKVKSNYAVGETFSLIIGVNSVFRKISGVDIVGSYDSSKLELLSVKKSDSFVFNNIGDCTFPNKSAGKFVGACYVEDSMNDREVNGELVVLNFLAEASGSAEVSLNCKNGDTLESNIVSDSKDILVCDKMVQHLSFGIGQAISATPFPNKVTPECGISGTYTKTPATEELCKTGTPSNVVVNRTTMIYRWSCTADGTTKNCLANPANGGMGILKVTPEPTALPKCGPANGQIYVGKPANETLCDVGTFRDVTTNTTTGVSTWKCVVAKKIINCATRAEDDNGKAFLMFSPSNGTYGVGETFDVLVSVDSAYNRVNSVDVKGTYNDEIIRLISATKANDMVFGNDGWCSIDMSISGSLVFVCSPEVPTVSGMKVNGNLMRLTFQTIKSGSTKLAFLCTKGSHDDSNITIPSSTTDTDVISCNKNVDANFRITEKVLVGINGKCGTLRNTCINGEVNDGDVPDTNADYRWRCLGSSGGKNVICTLKKPVNGKCGSKRNNCIAGETHDGELADTNSLYRWKCVGKYGGKTVSCSLRK